MSKRDDRYSLRQMLDQARHAVAMAHGRQRSDLESDFMFLWDTVAIDLPPLIAALEKIVEQRRGIPRYPLGPPTGDLCTHPASPVNRPPRHTLLDWLSVYSGLHMLRMPDSTYYQRGECGPVCIGRQRCTVR